MPVAIPERQLFIGGQWVSPCKGGRIPIVNPVTEETIGSIPAATPDDVEAAVAAAQACVESGSWTKATGAYRAKYLRAIAEKVGRCLQPLDLETLARARTQSTLHSQVKEKKSFLASLESLDNGKPLAEAEWDMVSQCCWCSRLWCPVRLTSSDHPRFTG